MSENADCPSPDQLHRALVGELPPDRRNAIEQHLLECGACAEQTLHSGDLQTYSQALRESAQRSAEVVSGTDAEQLEQLLDRVRSLPHQQEATQLSGVTRGAGETDLESDLIGYLQPARADAELGWLGTYRVLKLLGSGGMGGVFLAEDTQLHRRVALKVMRPDVSGQANADERFLREARAAAAVHHDHIVTIFQVGRDGQVPFLAMEFLEGESLEDRLRRERVMPLVDILRIGREIAEGLAAAHARGLVHRDIKPANIWLESRGAHLPNTSNEVVPPRVKLLDFGLARSADVNFELTSQGMVIGTPAYMAPEQAAGDMVDHRADLFSLGIVLYRLATGALPFQGKDAIATLVAIRSDTPGDPRKLRTDLPPALCDLIMQLLHKSPAERPASAAEVARRLAEIPLSASSAPVPRNAPTLAYQHQPPGKSRGFKWIVTAGAIFSLFLMGVIVVVTTDRGRVEVHSKVDDVNVEVYLTPENGTAIKAFDNKTGSKVDWFWSGKYEVAIKSDTNSVQLDKQQFTLKRGVTEILTLTRKPAVDSSPTAGSKPQIINANAKIAPPASIPEPPPLAEWLKGRTILTVAQDGSGQFKTINEAIQQLKSGQAIQVMDRGPYRELIDLASPPEDSGLIGSRDTVIELPNWIDDPQVGAGVRGHRISFTDRFRLSGLTWLSPPGEKGDLLRLYLANGIVMEQCVFRSATKSAVLVQFDPQPRLQMVHIRECGFFDGALLLGGDARHGRLIIENNYFHKRGALLSWQQGRFGRLVFRHNVCDYLGPNFHGLVETSDGIELSNNTILAPGPQFVDAAPARGVTIRNNIVQYGVAVYNSAGTLLPPVQWQLGHNGYLEYGEGPFKPLVAQSPTDVAPDPDFLSVDSTHRDYARIPADAPAGTAGAGGDWPGYLGALPPGPAPKEGDWFTRLQERWSIENVKRPETSAPVKILEPPPLGEWLKGRKVLTVAQDGSGQFKTIQAALDALEPGEAVKVLDKGPYRELLLIPALPFDSGLISEVQTILESPEWKLDYQEDDPATGGKIDVYRGHSLNGANGFRWHGFEMRFPPSNGKRVRRCGGARTKGFVLENCFIQTSESESVEGEPVAISDFHDGDGVGMSVWMRECVIEGSVSLVAAHKRLHPDPDHGSTAVFERNYFLGVGTQHHLLLAGESMEKVIIRHNVFAGKSGIDIHLHQAGLSDSLNVSNNLLLSPTGISFLQSAPLGAVTIRNNLYNRDALVSFVGVEEGSRQIARRWNIDHNAYPAVRAGISPEHVLTRPQGDIAVLPRFLSKVPQEADYLRIPADDPLATAGAGGKWPTYLGALPPGPAPEEGDWFSRLRARWQTGINKSVVDSPIRPPAVTAEPSTIAEWLKGRDVVTVAQDGSGQHKTIGEAIRALRAGQVVKVLDRGPYRERLDFESAPDDTGLISDQQAVIELPTWKKSDNAGIEGHVICFANGFRINGFAFEIAKDLEVPSFAHGLVIKQSAGVVLENCSIRWSGRSETFMGVTWFTEGPSQTCRIRECLFGNGVILNSLNSKANVVIEKCFFTGSEGGLDVSVSDGIFDQITIRENVFGRDQHDSDILINSSRHGSHINHLQITNNTTLASTPLTVSGNVPTGQFHIRNQLRLHPGLIRFVKNAEVELPRAIREWDVGHNVYPRSLRAGEGGLAIENLFPKATTDVLAPIEFLSTDINSRDYLRIASNILPSDLAKGGGLPNHAGAFPPGPPPQEGDWFTRLRERWPVKKDIPTAAPAAIPKVASLKEWLRDREVVTVAQDGSGQHQTIGAAIRALRTGQVVKVLDRGPYKEQLRFDGIPADTGLISEQQTIVETESWDSVHHAHSFGPLNGFRLTGMRFIAPQSDDWRTITTWIQPSGLVIDDCSFARRIGGPAKITAETSIYLIFRTGGSDVKPVVIQNCLFDGGSVTCASQTDEHPLVAVTHNFFRRSFVSLNNLVGTVVVRDNVFEFDNASILWIEGVNKVRDRLEISNNTSFQVTPFDRGSGIHFVGKAPEDNVIIRNNVTDSGVISDVSEEQRKRVRQQWQMDHNAYVRELGSFAKSPSDLLISPKYLSSDPNHRDAWRIAADSELANGGAGGAWPTYIGAFAPGPAPPDGDWFSRLRDKWAKELGRK